MPVGLEQIAVRVIGVLDLLGGCAVRARAGRRELYAPVETVAGTSIEAGNALALARAYLDRLELTELYVADLDAILGRGPQDSVVRPLAELGVPLWLDAGGSSVDSVRRGIDLGAASVVVGLETLPSFDALRNICDAVGGERIAFSLDLRNGKPIVASSASDVLRDGGPVVRFAVKAARTGVASVIVLDLARVGMRRGLDFHLISTVRATLPGLTLVAGGGIRGLADVKRLATIGCDGVLAATALQDGRLRAAEIASAR